jgi:NADH-quinone oxidoreductase subunit L
VVTLPLILLAIPSVAIGYFTVGPMLFGDFFGDAITVLPARRHDRRWPARWARRSTAGHGPLGFALHGFVTAPAFWLALRRLRRGDLHLPVQPGLRRRSAKARWRRSTASSRTSTASTTVPGRVRRRQRAARPRLLARGDSR